MKRFRLLIAALQIFFVACGASCRLTQSGQPENLFVDFTVDPQQTNVEFFWSDDDGKIFKSFQNVKNYVEKNNRRLRFAMNGGMY